MRIEKERPARFWNVVAEHVLLAVLVEPVQGRGRRVCLRPFVSLPVGHRTELRIVDSEWSIDLAHTLDECALTRSQFGANFLSAGG